MTVTLNRTKLDAFRAQWPCRDIPATLASIAFDFADNGDIVAKSRKIEAIGRCAVWLDEIEKAVI